VRWSYGKPTAIEQKKRREAKKEAGLARMKKLSEGGSGGGAQEEDAFYKALLQIWKSNPNHLVVLHRCAFPSAAAEPTRFHALGSMFDDRAARSGTADATLRALAEVHAVLASLSPAQAGPLTRPGLVAPAGSTTGQASPTTHHTQRAFEKKIFFSHARTLTNLFLTDPGQAGSVPRGCTKVERCRRGDG
jgi:hypothetical protein